MKRIDKIKTCKETINQFIKFNLVGILNTALDFAVFTLLIFLGVQYLISQVISYSCGIINSYLWNKFWTFKQKKGFSGFEALKFIVVNILSLGISLLMLYVFRDKVGLHVMVSKVIATFFSVIVNFTGNKFWVFK